MLCFYDEWVYKIGNRAKDVVEITNAGDVDALNRLQVLNSLDHLYFDDQVSESYIRKLFSTAKPQRNKNSSVLQVGHSYIDDEGLEHIPYHSYNHGIKINLELSFISQTKKAKHHVLSDFVVQLRNENLRGKIQ